MPQLPLAVKIADAVTAAVRERRALDAERLAEDLYRAHPDADASRDDIFAVLVAEGAAAGFRVGGPARSPHR